MNTEYPALCLHLHLCIWRMLLSKATYIAFQGLHICTFLSDLMLIYKFQ